MSLNDVLSKLGVGSKETVYMSVTPGVGLELIQLDYATKSVKNYACRPLEYNESLREIPDMDAFKTAVLELFEELRVNIKSNVVLNLPTVLFGSKELPLIIGEDSITEALTSEVEQSYIFKRYEPIVSWVDSNVVQQGDVRKFFYSAIQKNVVESIRNALDELGATLVGVEISLTSVLKALTFSGIADEQLRDGISWNLMLITPNGYSICSLVGKNVIEYYEEPLAIKSFDGDEIYNAINASAQISLMSFPANYMYVISETDLVSAELLSSRIQFDGVINYIENNDFKKQDIIPVSLEILEDTAHKISLEAIGIAVGNAVDLPVKFEFAGKHAGENGSDNPNEPVRVTLGGYEFEVSPNAARNIALVIAAVLLIPVLALMIIFPMLTKQSQAKLDEINSKIQSVQSNLQQYEGDDNAASFDVNTEIKKVIKDNRAKLMAYTAIGEAVPKKLWLTYFLAKDDGKIDIKGEASGVEDVTVFFKNMKDSLVYTQLRLHKLDLNSLSIDDAVSSTSNSDYQFEITNMSDSELAPVAEEVSSETEDTNAGGKRRNKRENPEEGNSITNLGEIEEDGN